MIPPSSGFKISFFGLAFLLVKELPKAGSFREKTGIKPIISAGLMQPDTFNRGGDCVFVCCAIN